MDISNDELVTKIRKIAEQGKILVSSHTFNHVLDTRPDLAEYLDHIQTSLFIGEIVQLGEGNKSAARDYLCARQHVYQIITDKLGRQQIL